MEEYKIMHPYLGVELSDGFLEVDINSKTLNYSEIQTTHFGVQCNNSDNEKEILSKCRDVADLIREIDKLNRK